MNSSRLNSSQQKVRTQQLMQMHLPTRMLTLQQIRTLLQQTIPMLTQTQMQQMMVDEAPALWLYQQDTLYAYNSKKVQNWTARTDEVVLMDGVSVAG